VTDLPGLEQVPRRNGELVFEAPWQSRVFGMAVALNQARDYDWDEFRRRLIAEIGNAPDREYYATWLSAFERLLLESNVLSADELERRKAEYISMERDDAF
jgi:nitrile hydratase accessory protein